MSLSEKCELWEHGLHNTNTILPNLYLTIHGNVPSRQMQNSLGHKNYNARTMTFKIPKGFILIYFTPENTQFWGHDECLRIDYKLLSNPTWTQMDHPLTKLGKIYFPDEDFLNLQVQFDEPAYFDLNVFTPTELQQHPEQSLVKKGIQAKAKLSGSDHPPLSLKTYFNYLDKERNVQIKKDPSLKDVTQLVYLMACNPFPITVTDDDRATSKSKQKEFNEIIQLRRRILDEGKLNFNTCKKDKSSVPLTSDSIREGYPLSSTDRTRGIDEEMGQYFTAHPIGISKPARIVSFENKVREIATPTKTFGDDMTDPNIFYSRADPTRLPPPPPPAAPKIVVPKQKTSRRRDGMSAIERARARDATGTRKGGRRKRKTKKKRKSRKSRKKKK